MGGPRPLYGVQRFNLKTALAISQLPFFRMKFHLHSFLARAKFLQFYQPFFHPLKETNSNCPPKTQEESPALALKKLEKFLANARNNNDKKAVKPTCMPVGAVTVHTADSMPGSPRAVWFVRHGARLDVSDPEWLKTAGRQHDTPISPEGVIEAQNVGSRLAPEKIDHIFSSPFLRAVETAHCCAEMLGLPIKIENGLAECFFTKWFPYCPDFIPTSELIQQFPRVDNSYGSVENPVYPETNEEMMARTRRAIEAIIRSHPGNLLLVGHGGSGGGLVVALAGEGAAIHAPTCCLVKLVENNGRWIVELDGSDTSHLRKTAPNIRNDPTIPAGVQGYYQEK